MPAVSATAILVLSHVVLIQRHTFTDVQIFLKFSHRHCFSKWHTLPLGLGVCALALEPQAKMAVMMAREKARFMF